MMDVQTQSLRFVVTDSRTVVADAIRAAQAMMKLDRARGWNALNELFRAGLPPTRPLAGDYRGELVALNLPPLTGAMEKMTAAYLPWLGKSFDAGNGRGINRFARNSLPLLYLFNPTYRGVRDIDSQTYRAFTFETYIAAGLIDADRAVMKLDYNIVGNPARTVRRVLDEVVEVADDLYLGKAHLNDWVGGWQTIAFFALTR